MGGFTSLGVFHTDKEARKGCAFSVWYLNNLVRDFLIQGKSSCMIHSTPFIEVKGVEDHYVWSLLSIYNIILYTLESIAKSKPANVGASFFPVFSFSPLLNNLFPLLRFVLYLQAWKWSSIPATLRAETTLFLLANLSGSFAS